MLLIMYTDIVIDEVNSLVKVYDAFQENSRAFTLYKYVNFYEEGNRYILKAKDRYYHDRIIKMSFPKDFTRYQIIKTEK